VRVAWVWTAVLWVLLAVPAAVLLGRIIHRAEQEEIGTPRSTDAVAAPPHPRSSTGA
jgi:hypothetical protein